jgi:hypothetical protein
MKSNPMKSNLMKSNQPAALWPQDALAPQAAFLLAL